MGTLLRATTVVLKKPGNVAAAHIYRRQSPSWIERPTLVKRQGGAWVTRYSRPDVIAQTPSRGTFMASGASSAGRTYTDFSPFSIISGGTLSPHWHWLVEYVSGDSSIQIENPGDPNTRFYRDFSGVGNGQIATAGPTTFQIGLFDDDSGAAAYDRGTLSIGWQNTIPAYTPISLSGHSVAGSASGFGSSGNPESGIPDIIVSGGNGNNSFSWGYVSGNVNIQPDPNSVVQNPRFFVIGLGASPQTTNTITGVWRCTCTDGVSANFIDIGITLSYTNLSG